MKLHVKLGVSSVDFSVGSFSQEASKATFRPYESGSVTKIASKFSSLVPIAVQILLVTEGGRNPSLISIVYDTFVDSREEYFSVESRFCTKSLIEGLQTAYSRSGK